MLTQERLKELLHYDPETGIFTWIISRGKSKAGSIAKNVGHWGYIIIGIDGKCYKAHRLAWLYVYGNFPLNNIDHLDHNRTNNKISNLRDATYLINNQNICKIRKNKTSLLMLGVHHSKRKKKPFKSSIRINGVPIALGSFKTELEAHNAYLEAKRKYHEGNVL